MLLIKFHFTSRPVYILTRNGNEEEREKLNLKRSKGQKWQHGHFKSCLHISNKSTPFIPVMKTDSLSPFNPKTVQSFSLSKIIADTSALSLSLSPKFRVFLQLKCIQNPKNQSTNSENLSTFIKLLVLI